MHRLACLAIASVFAAACGSDPDPVSVSEPIGINVKIKSADVTTGAASADKAITSESGNPWGAFISRAQTELGVDPGDIELDSLELLLATTSVNVSELREVWDGTVDVQFEMNDTNNIYPVGSATINDTLTGRSVDFSRSFDFAALATGDVDKLFNGSFDVLIGGPAAATFSTKGAEAELQLTLTFSAYE